MANQKTTTNLKSQEQSMKTTIQYQLAKIKKEEEEELWISGEELYTEGSSDEEEYKTQSRSRRKVNSNQSSRASSANASVERRGRSPASTEIKTKSDHSTDSTKEGMTERQSSSKNALKSLKTSTTSEKLHSSLMRSQEAQRASITDSFNTLTTKDTNSSDVSVEEAQTDDSEISWKANRDTEEEWIEKEILEVKNLDNLIYEMNNKVKEASKETLFYQRKNRERLENILSSCPPETGKLADNTQQFLQLCPRYTMLDAEFCNGTEFNTSLEGNNLKHQVFDNKDNINIFSYSNELYNYDSKLSNMTDKEERKIMNLMSDVKNADKIPDFHNNPYVVDKRTEEVLLELENKVHSEVFYNQGQPVKSNNNVSTTNTIISTFDTVSTIKSLQGIDKHLLDTVIQEARITDLSSILKIAEN